MIQSGSNDGADLVAARRSGELSASRRFVHHHQRDLLRAGYLLTGSAPAAAQLARETLLDFLQSDDDVPGYDLRGVLLGELARRYLHAPRQPRDQTPGRPGGRYAVDDERQRLVSALELLDPATRAATVLSDFGALPGQDVARATGMTRFDAGQRVERARARLIDAAGRSGASTSAPVYDLLGIIARDAPPDDLWPEIGPDLRAYHARQRRRSRLITAGAVGALVVALVAAVIWLGGVHLWPDEAAGERKMAAAPTPQPTAGTPPPVRTRPAPVEPTPLQPDLPVATVPDLQLMMAVEQGGALQSALLSYDPEANATAPLLDAGAAPMVSPDGRWLVAQRPNPDAAGELLLSGRSLVNEDVEWQVSVPGARTITLSNIGVYLLTRVDEGTGQLALRAYDITSGLETTPDPVMVPLGSPAYRDVWLFASPDGDLVHALGAEVTAPLGVWVRTLVTVETSSWEASQPLFHAVEPRSGQVARDFDLSAAVPTPDGKSLYSIVPGFGDERLDLQFLDLASGRVSTVGLPFSAYQTEFSPRGFHAIPSNTGRMLYVLQTERREVAIVDLVKRRVEAVLAIDSGAAPHSMVESVFRYTSFVDSAFSPDGTKLYLINIRPGIHAVNTFVSQSPVWVINTSNWTISEYWMVLGRPRAITISGDGGAVYVRSTRVGGGDILTAFDSATGEILGTHDAIPAPEWASIQRLTSVSNLYRQQYARSPAVAGVEPRDNLDYEVLPSARVDAEGDLIFAGATTTVVVRMIDPVTGSPLGESGGGKMRYDPEASIGLSLSHQDGSEVVIFPWRDGPGVYRAEIRLAEAGWWDARITVINRDGSTWTISQPQAIEAAHPFRLASGEVYGLRVRPDAFVSQRTLTVRVQPVHPETGRRARNIGDLSGMPEQIELEFTHESGERLTATLDRMEDGTFIGWTTFAEAGRWEVTVSFVGPGDTPVTIAAEPIEIRDIDDPSLRGGDAAGIGNQWTSRPDSK